MPSDSPTGVGSSSGGGPPRGGSSSGGDPRRNGSPRSGSRQVGSRPVASPEPPEPSALGSGVWVELSVAADIEAVEVVSEILTRFAPGGTSVEPGFGLIDEGLGAVVDTTKPAIVRAYLPGIDPAGVEAAVAEATLALGHLQAFDLRPIGELQTRLVHEADWAEAWKSYFPVLRVGRRIVIRPTWRRHRRRPDDVVLSLDPGMAFGTGLHPTTRLCLAALETLADEGLLGSGHGAGLGSGRGTDRGAGRAGSGADRGPGSGRGTDRGAGRAGSGADRGAGRDGSARVIDVGCGSGILAIAAAKLGAGELLGIDTDPIAVESTLANARLNGLARRIHVRRGSLPSGEGPFDLVLANLIASLLVQLAGLLRDEMAPGGRMVASGIFRDREDDVRAAFEAAGLQLGRRWAEEDWVALEAVRA